jgi:hypothetical protein
VRVRRASAWEKEREEMRASDEGKGGPVWTV